MPLSARTCLAMIAMLLVTSLQHVSAGEMVFIEITDQQPAGLIQQASASIVQTDFSSCDESCGPACTTEGCETGTCDTTCETCPPVQQYELGDLPYLACYKAGAVICSAGMMLGACCGLDCAPHEQHCDCDKCRLKRCQCDECRRGQYCGTNRWGYFCPSGGRDGKGVPWAGKYGMIYPLNAGYYDARDTRLYAAAGTGVPMTVPLAPTVGHVYNFGWGIPSSRLTPMYRNLPFNPASAYHNTDGHGRR